MSSLYTAIISAKTGEQVPCFSSGATLFSRYAPQRECTVFAAQDCFATAGFYIIGGIGSGLHLISLLEAHPDACIVAVETDNDTIAFLKENLILPSLRANLVFTTIGKLEQTITEHYLPAVHGNLTFQCLRSWESAISPEQKKQLTEAVRHSITAVSRDYGVQAHFGLLWNRNILQNFKLWCSQASDTGTIWWDDLAKSIQRSGKQHCVILAAGPTLDAYLDTYNGSADTWLIAVDTALPTLIKRLIAPDMVVTIDPQIASMRHFLLPDNADSLLQNTILASDFCGSCGAARLWQQKKRPVLFFNENHPLGLWCSRFISSDSEPFLNISAGGGTVTHSALELAWHLGFTDISIHGADFGFPQGRPYARGTYLEDRYLHEMSRLQPVEHQYAALMYRTPLETDEKRGYQTTAVLAGYGEAFEKRYSQIKQSQPFHFSGRLQEQIAVPSDILERFKQEYLTQLKKNDEKVQFSVLPLLAHLKSKGENSDILMREQLEAAIERQLK